MKVMEPAPAGSYKTHILTVALEDYFHGPAFSKVISRKRWGHFDSRFEQNCLNLLDRLDETSATATFFASPWVARKCPQVVREVIARGHEVGLAGPRNVSFRSFSRESLRDQLQRDRDVLEQQIRRRVLGYRVTDIWLGRKQLWALDELAELGFRYDSSFSPFLRHFAEQPWRRYVHKHQAPNGEIWEVPLSSVRTIAGMFIPFAGGNYFRQFPEWLIQDLLKKGDESEIHPLVLYFRLWDLDKDQPRLQTGSVLGDVRHYRNAERVFRMFNELLERFRFSSVARYLKLETPADETTNETTRSAFIPRTETSKLPSMPRTNGSRTPISVVVPCFNEAEGIPFLASNLRWLRSDLRGDYIPEFVLVDDGSSDNTWELLQKYFANERDVILLRHSVNRGVSQAIMTGLKRSREIACSIDCDCSYDPSELRPMLNLMKPGVDLVTASPYHPAGKVLNVPHWRLLLSKASSSFYRLVTGTRIHTFTACVRVYRRSAAIDTPLRYAGFLGVAELMGKMALAGKTIVEHPATLEVRIFGHSKMKILRTIMGHLKLLGSLYRQRLTGSKTAFDASDDTTDADVTVSSDSARATRFMHSPLSETLVEGSKAEVGKSSS